MFSPIPVGLWACDMIATASNLWHLRQPCASFDLMKVRELIEALQKLNPDSDVLTNQCSATSSHEEVSPVDTVEQVDEHVFVGTEPAR